MAKQRKKTKDVDYIMNYNFEPEKSRKKDFNNKVSTNMMYKHLKHNKKHQIDWDGAVFIN